MEEILSLFALFFLLVLMVVPLMFLLRRFGGPSRSAALRIIAAEWRELAGSLGLGVKQLRRHRVALEGQLDGVELTAQLFDAPYNGETVAQFTLEIRAFLPETVSRLVAFRPLDRSAGVPEGARPVATGDTSFDASVLTLGSTTEAVALLDAATRAEVRRFVEGTGGTLAARELVVRLPYAAGGSELVRDVLKRAARLAQRLAASAGSVPARLGRNVEADPVPGVRRRSFLLLAQTYGPDSPELAAAARALSQATEPRLRWLGAAHLRDAADAPLAELLAAPQAGCVLDEAEAQAVALALGRRGKQDAEPVLLELLAQDEPDVQTAAARALAHCGTASSVGPLTERAGGGEQLSVRWAARDALAALRLRLPREGAGALSLAAQEAAGELSLASGQEAGGLMLASGQEAGGLMLAGASGDGPPGLAAEAGAGEPGPELEAAGDDLAAARGTAEAAGRVSTQTPP